MIDLVTNFIDHEREIADIVKGRAESYYQSQCYKILDRRMNDLQNSNDLKPQALRRNDWMSHLVFPIVKERALIRRAITAANYRANDIFSLSSMGSTPPENSQNAELVLNINMAHTFFRMKCLKPMIDTASKFGSAVTYTFWRTNENAKLETIYNPKTGRYDRIRSPNLQKNAVSKEVSPRDYFQNPEVPDPEESDFQGHYRRAHISELIPLMDDETYIRENLGKVIEDMKHGIAKNQNRPWEEKERTKWGTDILHWEGVIPIKGNEDGDQKYCVEMIGDTIIKLSVDDYDGDMRSYTVSSFDKRSEYWWGNSDSEYVVAHENFLNTMLGMTADNAMRSMQQYVFYSKDSIDIADISNASRSGGFVPVDAKNIPLSQLINPFQPSNISQAPAQFITQMVNDSIQKMSTKIDLSRQTNQGGGVLNNTTATGANILAGQADVQEADILENFDYGVVQVGLKSLILLQQFLGELFYVRPRPQDVEMLLNKYQILGKYDIVINTTAMKNKQNELLRMQNLATWLLNVTANPALQQAGYNVVPLVNDILKKAEIPSIDDIIPKQNEQLNAPGMVPSSQGPVSATGGGGMMPMNLPGQNKTGAPASAPSNLMPPMQARPPVERTTAMMG